MLAKALGVLEAIAALLKAWPQRKPSDEADIRLEVVKQGSSPSHGGRGVPYPFVVKQDSRPSLKGVPSPFGEGQGNPLGFNEQGLPDWVLLWAKVRVANIGREEGQLICDLNKAKTKLPSLFDRDKITPIFPSISIAGRSESRADFRFYVLFNEQDPWTFARALKDLVKSKKRYRIAIRYWTRRVDGRSRARKLYIKGDFQGFYQKVLEDWEGFGFKDLADLVRLSES